MVSPATVLPKPGLAVFAAPKPAAAPPAPLLPTPDAGPTRHIREMARNMVGGTLAPNANWHTIRAKLRELDGAAMGAILHNCDAPRDLPADREARVEWVCQWLTARAAAIAATNAPRAPAPA